MTDEKTAPAALDADLKAADDAFFEALLNADGPALEEAVADGFLIVDVAEGNVHDRATFLGGIAAGMIVFNSIERFHDEAVVREVAPGAGVVVGRTRMSIVAPDGSSIEAASRYTHVFRHDDGRWQLFSAQGTPIAEASAA